ncbi:MAG: hypothetical protein WCF16_01675 [Alphaproteobacteria bacterium]
MRALILFGFVVLLAAIFSSRLVPTLVGRQMGIKSSGDWLVMCRPDEELCLARLELQKGERRSTEVRGEFGLLHVAVYAYPDGRKLFTVDLDDDPMPKFVPVAAPGKTMPFIGVKIDSVSIDGKPFPLSCVHHGCFSHRAPDVIGAMKQGKLLAVQPVNRKPIEIDIGDFGAAWTTLEDKLAKGEASRETPEFGEEDLRNMDPDRAEKIRELLKTRSERLEDR